MLFRTYNALFKASFHLPVGSITCIQSSGFHSSSIVSAGGAGAKSDLAKLRKKTGYSLSICKKALSENGQDLALAEKWLKEQAQAQGWAKAQKLQGRNTSQGLLGIKIKSNIAALVELNCETDFVARNKKFISLLDEITSSCVAHVSKDADQPNGRIVLDKVQVGNIVGEEGKSNSDLVALNIGQIGENIALGDATIIKVDSNSKLSGLSHPSSGNLELSKLQFGRYASILAYTSQSGGVLPEGQTDTSLARQICQHVIGMAPTKIDDESDRENSLLHQQFLLDEDLKVGQILKTSGIEILDFVRAEVGRSDSD